MKIFEHYTTDYMKNSENQNFEISHFSDFELRNMIVRNDEEAFSYLYDVYSGVLYGMALNMGLSQKEAEKIVELTFVSVWTNISLFDYQKFSLKTWTMQILLKYASEYISKSKMAV